ncbi:MAG: UPF0182 family protein [Desulfitobacterium sp.]|nr:UPF0182 family protein [Desulfitobacterium sp.]
MKKTWLFVIVGILLLGLAIYGISTLYMDWLWYSDLGYEILFWKPFISKIIMQLVNGSILFIFIAAFLFSIRHAILNFVNERLRKRLRLVHDLDRPLYQLSQRNISIYIVLFSALASFAISLITGFSGWLEVLNFFNPTSFGIVDPIFQKDLSFYVFQLPLFQTLFNTFFGPMILLTILIAVVYFFTGFIRIHSLCFWRKNAIEINSSALRHLSLLVAFLFLLRSLGYYLETYQLLYSQKGLVLGAGYGDIHGALPFLKLLSILCLGGFLGAILSFLKKNVRLLTIPLLLIFLSSTVFLYIWPALLQSLIVIPNELELETPYLENQIHFTRFAYGLDKVHVEDYPGDTPLAAELLIEEQETLAKIPIQDPSPLLQVYGQRQSLGQYYKFEDIYLDRYEINGKKHLINLTPRELNVNALESSAKTFVNTRFKYTHGFGVVASFAHLPTSDGLPPFIMKDVPITSNYEEFQLLQPRIYFGKLTNDWVIVNTDLREFDYPMGSKSVGYSYNGKTGISLTPFNRLMLTIQQGTPRLYLAKEIHSQSRILLYRNILERVEKLVPFLQYDEPYVVLDQGRLKWIIDGYTTSGTLPYSNMYPNRDFNYIRNSVKVVVDAYDGTVDYFAIDSGDPILSTYERIFPGVFKPLEEMSVHLQAHLRYPKSLFTMQSKILKTFHMTDPGVFYNKEDSWEIAQKVLNNEAQNLEPFYTLMRLPGQEEPEFVLLIPFTPSSSGANPPSNMRAWLVGRMDGDHYGELNLYILPKNTQVKSPWQIELRIDQDSTISDQLAIWEERGSRVIRGNLRILPLAGNFLFIEPIYLQSLKDGSIPELRKILVAYENKIVMTNTLEEALYELFKVEFDFSPDLKPLDLNSLSDFEVKDPVNGEANLQMLLNQIAQLKEMIQQLEEQIVNIYSEMLESQQVREEELEREIERLELEFEQELQRKSKGKIEEEIDIQY